MTNKTILEEVPQETGMWTEKDKMFAIASKKCSPKIIKAREIKEILAENLKIFLTKKKEENYDRRKYGRRDH